MHTPTSALNRRAALARALVMAAAAGQTTLPTRSLAQPTTPAPRPQSGAFDTTTIRGQTDADGVRLRLRDNWNGQFLVAIEPMSRFVTNIISLRRTGIPARQTIAINLRPLIIEAMHEWDRSRVPVRLARAGETPSVRIRQGVLARSAMLGWTNALAQTREITISPHNIATNAQLNYYELVRTGYLDSTTTLDAYASMIAALTVRHEIGHALGLGHTTAGATDQPNAHFTEIISTPMFEFFEPSIMTASHLLYFQALREIHLRAVTNADIRVTERDLDGANLMWDGRPSAAMTLDIFGCNSTCHDEL